MSIDASKKVAREGRLYGKPVLVLRERDNVTKTPKKTHKCPVEHGEWKSNTFNIGTIIQCECGRRYRCRKAFGSSDGYATWVRRWLPWPPKQKWPEGL